MGRSRRFPRECNFVSAVHSFRDREAPIEFTGVKVGRCFAYSTGIVYRDKSTSVAHTRDGGYTGNCVYSARRWSYVNGTRAMTLLLSLHRAGLLHPSRSGRGLALVDETRPFLEVYFEVVNSRPRAALRGAARARSTPVTRVSRC